MEDFNSKKKAQSQCFYSLKLKVLSMKVSHERFSINFTHCIKLVINK